MEKNVDYKYLVSDIWKSSDFCALKMKKDKWISAGIIDASGEFDSL